MSGWQKLAAPLAVGCTLTLCLIGWAATTITPGFCGNCRRDLAAQRDLAWIGPWLVVTSMVATIIARPQNGCSPIEQRICRISTLIAAIMWITFSGFTHGWW